MMVLKHCPKCDTASVAGNNVCLNCYTLWQYVQPYYIGRKAKIFLATLAFLCGAAFCIYCITYSFI
jgi:hypothetical protein